MKQRQKIDFTITFSQPSLRDFSSFCPDLPRVSVPIPSASMSPAGALYARAVFVSQGLSFIMKIQTGDLLHAGTFTPSHAFSAAHSNGNRVSRARTAKSSAAFRYPAPGVTPSSPSTIDASSPS